MKEVAVIAVTYAIVAAAFYSVLPAHLPAWHASVPLLLILLLGWLQGPR